MQHRIEDMTDRDLEARKESMHLSIEEQDATDIEIQRRIELPQDVQRHIFRRI